MRGIRLQSIQQTATVERIILVAGNNNVVQKLDAQILQS